jgi:uncharacterized membrane protein HdeD (DUF308 family)
MNLGAKFMKTLFGIILCLLGSFLIGLTVNSLGNMGNILVNIIGVICISVGIIMVIKRRKNET